MDDHTNPFSDNYRETEGDESPVTEHEKSPDDFDNSAEEAGAPRINSDAIADYLLQKKYILTALELHMELLESGKELPRLRNYFSNPANFEQQGNGSLDGPSSLHRAGSISTFDSLDLTHSDDGHQHDDRVAVLEFELRKANETIRSLRMSLTGTLEEDSFLKVDDVDVEYKVFSQKKDNFSTGYDEVEFNPLIKRALNYLVNEYLLQNDYKLASITLADEIEGQDFEDWDDVGLNMPKPPNLLKLFHDYSSRNLPNHKSCDACVAMEKALEEMEETMQSIKDECERLENENSELNELISQLNKESAGLRGSISSSTPRKSETALDNHAKVPVSRSNSNVTTRSKSVTDFVKQRADAQRKMSVLCQPSSTRMSSKFWELLFLFWRDEADDNDGLSNEVSLLASSPKDLVSTLSISIPKVIPSIAPEKRDQVIPLLLSTAAMQQDANVRNSLLHNLFNLIEKPERRQRQIILSSCVAYAKVVGPLQTEEDVLPQFWEQIGHKHLERRHLVAEACGAIAPFLQAEMRSSLLLSILQQMTQEESSEKVREAIVRSLAVLFSLMEDEDKYIQAFRMVNGFLKDKSLPVQQAARRYLLLSFACWSKQTGKLCNHLFDHFLHVLELCTKDEKGNRFMNFSQADFINSLENLHVLLPCLFADILQSMPQEYRLAKASSTSSPVIPFDNDLYNFSLLLEKEDEFQVLYEKFRGCIASSSLDNWKPLSSLVTDFIPRLLQVVRDIHPAKNECVTALSEFFASIVILFGLEFVKSWLKDKRSELFYMEGEEDINREISFENTPFTSAAVAVYGCGILATCAEHEQSEELITFLNDTLVALATCHAPLSSLELAMIEIRKKGGRFHDIILDVLWGGIAHPSAFVRAGATSLFKVMTVGDVDVKILTTRVMPALLSVSKDKEECVQTATLPVFGALLECSHAEEEVIDRVVAQLSAFMAPSEGSAPHHHMNVEMVKTMAEVTPKADPKFCNEFVLPHLAAIAARNNQQSNKTKRSDIALEMLQAFTNISFCYIPDSLLQSALIPGLRCLLQDMEKLHTEHVPKVERLIKDMELKLEQRTPVPIPEPSSPTDKTKANKPKFYNKLF